MARRCYDEMQISATIASVHSDACRDPVEDIRNDAFNEYQRVKKHKQNELNIRRTTGSNGAQVVLTKQQKKKDDNHASAVASRSKQEYLLKKFEEVLLKKISDTNLLSMGYTQAQTKIQNLNKVVEQKDRTIAHLTQQLSVYRDRKNNYNYYPSPNNNATTTTTTTSLITVAKPEQDFVQDSNNNNNSNSNGRNTANSFSDHSTHHVAHPGVDLAATMDEIISTDMPMPIGTIPTASSTIPVIPAVCTTFGTSGINHKLVDHSYTHQHLLAAQPWTTGKGPEEFAMSNINPAA